MPSPNLRRMRLISIIWGLVMFILVAGLTVVGVMYKNNTKKYKEIESTLVEAAKKYLEDKSLEIDDNIKLLKEELEPEIPDDKKESLNECDAYVKVEKKKSTYDYQGYIKCAKYKTKNYE